VYPLGHSDDPQFEGKRRGSGSGITKGGTIALGPDKVSLLEAVRQHASIPPAARSLDICYRRTWLLVDELDRSFKSPAAISEQGGQSRGGCVPMSEQCRCESSSQDARDGATSAVRPRPAGRRRRDTHERSCERVETAGAA
jgi:hypothetical protein